MPGLVLLRSGAVSAAIDPATFQRVYRQSVPDVMRFITPERQELVARHDLSLHPATFRLDSYLYASERRYAHLVALTNRHLPAEVPPEALEVGGFLGAYPLTLARMGIPTTLVEQYGYYYGAFDDLAAFLTAEGVRIWDADFTEPLPDAAGRYTLVTNMAMLEHLSGSPRQLMLNLRACTHPDGLVVLDVPNVAYWPNRLRALRGESIHQPLQVVYASAPPYLGHHREYTLDELSQLLTWTGFRLSESVLFNYSLSLTRGTSFERLYTLVMYLWPTLLFPACRELIMVAARPVADLAEPPTTQLLRGPPAVPAGS